MQLSTDFCRVDHKLVDGFQSVPASIAGDAMGRRRCTSAALHAISPPSSPIAGTVLTVETPAGNNYPIHKALEYVEPGTVLVVDAGGHEKRAVWGELMSRFCAARDVAAVVIDGAVRDASALEEFDLPVYAIGTTPTGPIKEDSGHVGEPVSCDGVSVSSGDVAVCDRDGVGFVPRADAAKILEKCQSRVAQETDWMEAADDPETTTLEILGLTND